MPVYIMTASQYLTRSAVLNLCVFWNVKVNQAGLLGSCWFLKGCGRVCPIYGMQRMPQPPTRISQTSVPSAQIQIYNADTIGGYA